MVVIFAAFVFILLARRFIDFNKFIRIYNFEFTIVEQFFDVKV